MTQSPAALHAGRELDALVSRTVMGGDVYPDGGGYYDFMEHVGPGQARTLPHYSTDIRAAWEVVEKLGGMVMRRDPVRDASGRAHYGVYFQMERNRRRDAGESYEATKEPWHYEIDNAPLAICRAALAAVGA